jgi:hypothetical protein
MTLVRPAGFLYYVMPYVVGASLRDRLNRGRAGAKTFLARFSNKPS